MTMGGFVIGMCKDIPRLFRGEVARSKGAKGGRKSTHQSTNQQFILANPSDMSRVEDGFARRLSGVGGKGTEEPSIK